MKKEVQFKNIQELANFLEIGGKAFLRNKWFNISSPVVFNETNEVVVKGDVIMQVKPQHLENIFGYKIVI